MDREPPPARQRPRAPESRTPDHASTPEGRCWRTAVGPPQARSPSQPGADPVMPTQLNRLQVAKSGRVTRENRHMEKATARRLGTSKPLPPPSPARIHRSNVVPRQSPAQVHQSDGGSMDSEQEAEIWLQGVSPEISQNHRKL